MKHAKFVSFTLCGAQTVQKAVKLLPDFRCERYARTVDASLSGTSLKRFAQQAMVDCDLIVFVGATGIAVRAAAPYLMGKAYDPAVIVIDEQGKFVIPLLSGHLGGANKIAKTLAEGLQAVPVLTTATDGRQVFAVDTWAKAHSCAVLEPHYIKYVSGALLRGETVGVRSDFPIDGLLPARIDLKKRRGKRVYDWISHRRTAVCTHAASRAADCTSRHWLPQGHERGCHRADSSGGACLGKTALAGDLRRGEH